MVFWPPLPSHKYHSCLYLGNIDFILQQKIAALLHSTDMQYAGIKNQSMTHSRKIESIMKWLINMLY